MGASQSTPSSSTTTSDPKRYDVFISFRGEDTRDSITSHLYDALCEKRIHTFIDYKLKRGDKISPALMKAIEESRISVIIFSENYASSKWCLRELAEIIKYKEKNRQIVIPVFYHVDPSDVRKQIGSFEDSFVKHENESQEEMQIWRDALTKASNLSGWDSSVTRPESKLVSEIVRDIWKKLNKICSSNNFQGLIGIDERLEQVISLLCLGMSDFRIIGIWGMGGIGKTTIADAVFKKISYQFEDPYFLPNIREESEMPGGLVRLREEILCEVLNEENLKVGSPTIPQSIKDRLKHKKVFIVLDDVNNFRSLEFLAGGVDGFGAGSRIIITTRDKQVLHSCGLNRCNIYEVKEFNNSESIQLFYNYAFNQSHPPEDLIVLSDKIVNYAKGNPLTVKVLGSSLKGKGKGEWESALNKLQRIFIPEIFDVLKISYNGLDDEEKDLFLNIACFFKGEDKDYVAKIIGDLNRYFSLDVLVNKSLITVSQNKIQMHDLLQEMGREIVRQESPDRPGNRSRLWKQDDILRILKNGDGADAVRGIFLDMSEIKNTYLSSQAFNQMHNLKFIKFYDSPEHYFGGMVYKSKVHFRSSLSYFSDELRSLNWLGYPLKALPSNFIPENLVELRITCSNLKRLWKGTKLAPKLKWLILHDCPHLTKIPDILSAPLIEEINLENCRSLLDIRSSVHHVNSLRYLKLRGCKNLRSFPSNIHFESLISLDLSYCINLTKFPQISGNIKTLYLCGTAIEEVPSSIQSLSKLVELNLSLCTRLQRISTSICKLKYLYELNLLDCSKLESFPEILETMESLEKLDLCGTAITYLHPSIERLYRLRELLLKGCRNLEELPSSICNLECLTHLNLSDCSNLGKLSGPSKSFTEYILGKADITQDCSRWTLQLSGLRSLRELGLNNCNITEISEFGSLSSLKDLDLCRNSFVSLPKSINELSKLRKLKLNDCNMLQSITELPVHIEYFEAMNCLRLRQSLPNSFRFVHTVNEGAEFIFTNSLSLDTIGVSNAFAFVESILARKIHRETLTEVSICLPGSEIPECFSYQNYGSSINIQVPRHKLRNHEILGFALCAVIGFEEYYVDNCGLKVGYEFHAVTDVGNRVDFHDSLTVCPVKYHSHGHSLSIDWDHIVLGSRPFLQNYKLFPRHGDGDHVYISFKFNPEDFVRNPVQGCKVKRCGVCLLE